MTVYLAPLFSGNAGTNEHYDDIDKTNKKNTQPISVAARSKG